MSDPCRWCGYRKPDPEGMTFVTDNYDCDECGATEAAMMQFGYNKGMVYKFWFNPDDSLFVECEKAGARTVRFTLTLEHLQRIGVATVFDEPPEGKR